MIYVFLLLAEGVSPPCLNSTPMPNTTEQYMNLKNKEFGKCSVKTGIISLSKLVQNYNEKRVFFKSYSVEILKEK